jgi:UPF0755 protein
LRPNKKRLALGCALAILVVLGAAFLFFLAWMKRELAPMPKGPAFYLRFRQETAFNKAVSDLSGRGVIRNPQAFKLYARWKSVTTPVPEGTYQFHPGMTVDTIIKALHSKIVQMVRIPETNLSYRTANLLEKRYNVASAKEYKELMNQPQLFKAEVPFPLPHTTLEGYLYPDTYDLPPLTGAHDTIVRQLQAFQRKVLPLMKGVKDRNKVLTIASMVELEAAKDKDRPLIAGVIVNRLKKGMPLQIDATILYALHEWRRLTFADYRNTISPYNTYLHNGLPPGPICSPSSKSVEAAIHPTAHEYLYYVAQPNGYHLFARTYPEHLANIAKARAERAKHA